MTPKLILEIQPWRYPSRGLLIKVHPGISGILRHPIHGGENGKIGARRELCALLFHKKTYQ